MRCLWLLNPDGSCRCGCGYGTPRGQTRAHVERPDPFRFEMSPEEIRVYAEAEETLRRVRALVARCS